MRHIANTNFHASICQNVPAPWREVVLQWIQLNLNENGLVPSVYLDHGFTKPIAVGQLWFRVFDPSFEFFGLLPYHLSSSFGPEESVKIAIDNIHETVTFSGTGKWARSAHRNRP